MWLPRSFTLPTSYSQCGVGTEYVMLRKHKHNGNKQWKPEISHRQGSRRAKVEILSQHPTLHMARAQGKGGLLPARRFADTSCDVNKMFLGLNSCSILVYIAFRLVARMCVKCLTSIEIFPRKAASQESHNSWGCVACVHYFHAIGTYLHFSRSVDVFCCLNGNHVCTLNTVSTLPVVRAIRQEHHLLFGCAELIPIMVFIVMAQEHLCRQ